MSRKLSRSISVDVDVHIDQFEDADILTEAVDVIKRHLSGTKPSDSSGWHGKQWKDCDDSIAEIRQSLSAWPVNEELLPPPSTAAKIHTAEQLHAFLESHKDDFIA